MIRALTRTLLAVAFCIVTLGFVVIGVRTSPEKNAGELPEWKQRNAQYGVELGQYEYTRCLNGWLIASTTAHNHLYVRDAEFNPIRCEGK